MMGCRRQLCLAGLLLAVACEVEGNEQHVDQPPPEVADQGESLGAAPEPRLTEGLHTKLDMLSRHARAIEARDALVKGDLRAARSAMADLASGQLDGLPPGLRASAEKVGRAAREASQAPTLEVAAQALGRVAAACADCHTAAGKAPEYPRAYQPDDFPDPVSHMWRHQWAADRMWEGLSGPWEVAWQAGAAQLKEPALKPATFGVVETEWTRYGKLAERVHALGDSATKANDPSARAATFGRLLATCGTCHSALGKGPEPKPRMPQQVPSQGQPPPPGAATL